MYHFGTALSAGIIATVLVCSSTFVPTPTEAATADKVAQKEANVACKAEAKDKKIRWPASRKFVSSCVTAALKDYSLDINQLRRDMNLNGLRVYTPEEIGCQQNVFC